MSDIFDNASDTEEMHRNYAIKAVRSRNAPKFSGHCLFCNEVINIGAYCSADCREDGETEARLKRIGGNKPT